jgi:hypothetical protein
MMAALQARLGSALTRKHKVLLQCGIRWQTAKALPERAPKAAPDRDRQLLLRVIVQIAKRPRFFVASLVSAINLGPTGVGVRALRLTGLRLTGLRLTGLLRTAGNEHR